MTGLALHLDDEVLERLAVMVADELERRRGTPTSATRTAQRWMTVDQAAEYIGASRQRVYDLRSAGQLGRHGDGRRALIDRNELDNLIEGRTR
jgi:excisionase family DNA binding protein